MEATKSFWQNNGKAQQLIVVVIVNLASMSFGLNSGWPSPAIPKLRSSQPPVGDTPFSDDQISWINSLAAIGGVLTIPFCGMLSERIGRKNFVILTGLPYIVGWLLVIFAQNHIYLYAARLADGMGIAMTIFIAPLFTSEIASDDIRGSLGSLVLFAINIGILVAYTVGAFLTYRQIASLCIIFPLIFVVAMLFVPETPVYLLRRNRQVEAHKSLMFFRGNNQALVEQELARLRSQTTIFDHCCKRVSLKEFFGDRATRKALIISIGMIAAQPLTGISAVTTYAETIFKLAGSSVSSEVASIITALIRIIGSQVATMLMERAGRRLLSLVSCLGMAVSLSIAALFFYLQRNEYQVDWISWLPLVALSAYIISFCLGIGPVPFVVISEVFRLDVTSFAATLCIVVYFVAAFIAIKMFDLVMQLRGPDGCFSMLALFSAIFFVFCYCLLPETKGRAREDIIDDLAGIDKSSSNKKVDVDKSTESKLLADNESVQSSLVVFNANNSL